MTETTFRIVCATLLPANGSTVGLALEASADRLRRSAKWRQLYVTAHFPKWVPQPGGRSAVHAPRASVAAMLKERRRGLGDRLVGARDPVTGASVNDEQLIDNLLTFYLAGHETTSNKLVLTQQVIKESMRLYPPVPTTSRQAIGEVRLGEYSINAGTSIVIPIMLSIVIKSAGATGTRSTRRASRPPAKVTSRATNTCRSGQVHGFASAWHSP
jgi:cytochrome P450